MKKRFHYIVVNDYDLRGCKFKSKFTDNQLISFNTGLYFNASSGKYGFGVVKVLIKI